MFADAAGIARTRGTTCGARRPVDPVREVRAARLDLCTATPGRVRRARSVIAHECGRVTERGARASDAGVVTGLVRVAGLQLSAVAPLLTRRAKRGVTLECRLVAQRRRVAGRHHFEASAAGVANFELRAVTHLLTDRARGRVAFGFG